MTLPLRLAASSFEILGLINYIVSTEQFLFSLFSPVTGNPRRPLVNPLAKFPSVLQFLSFNFALG